MRTHDDPNCAHAQELLSPYDDGTLVGERRAGLERHLARCEDCRLALADHRRALGALRGSVPERASQAEVARLLAAVDAATSTVPVPVTVTATVGGVVHEVESEALRYRRALFAVAQRSAPSRTRRVAILALASLLGAAAAVLLVWSFGGLRSSRESAKRGVSVPEFRQPVVVMPSEPPVDAAPGDAAAIDEPSVAQEQVFGEPTVPGVREFAEGADFAEVIDATEVAEVASATESASLPGVDEVAAATQLTSAAKLDDFDEFANAAVPLTGDPAAEDLSLLATAQPADPIAEAPQAEAASMQLAPVGPAVSSAEVVRSQPRSVPTPRLGIPQSTPGVALVLRDGPELELRVTGSVRERVPTLLSLLQRDDEDLVALASAHLEQLRGQVQALPEVGTAVDRELADAGTSRSWWSQLFGAEPTPDREPSLSESWMHWWSVAEPLLPADPGAGAA